MFPKNKFGVVFIYFLLCLIPFPLLADISASEELKNIEKNIRAESIALNALIQKIYPDYSETLETDKITKLKITSSQCRVRETIERSSRVMHSPTVNEDFIIIGRNDSYYHIKISGNRDGWIHETCGQVITETIERPKKGSKLSNTDIGKYLDFSEMIFSRIEENKKLADQIIDKNKVDKKVSSYRSIEKHYSRAVGIYNKYLKDRTAYVAENFPLDKRFSGSTEILFGNSNHIQNFLNGSKIDYDEFSRDFNIAGSFIIDKSSKVNILFGSKSEVLGTPYKTSNYGIGFNYTGIEKLMLNTNININSYNDEIVANNDYGRFQINANAKHQFSSNSFFNYGYSFMNNNFDVGDDRDYSSHKLSAIGDLKLSSMSKFVLTMLANFENSDSDYHNFTSLLPAISYQKKDSKKQTNFNLKYEKIAYEKLELLDYNKLLLSYIGNNNDVNKRKTTDLAISSKSFPENELSDYFQIKTRFASSSVGDISERKSFTLFTNLYPNIDGINYTDFRFDRNRKSIMSSDFSIYYRLWHDLFSSNDDSLDFNKPSVIDISGKWGFKFGKISIGPSFGLHAILDFDSDEIIERDGNLLRVGGVAEGPIISSSKFNITIMAAYDYGFVYDTALSAGELEERHPTTIKLTSTISAPIVRNIELIGRINYYKINTDMDEKISINPIEFTSRMSFHFGIRYRYN